MSGYLFDYGPGRLNVHFVQGHHGWMYMHLRLRTGVDTVTEVDDGFAPTGSSSGGGELLRRRLRISAAFCPFPQMIAWLAAISLGLDRCGWRWEGEGPEYELAWNGTQLVIDEEFSREQPDVNGGQKPRISGGERETGRGFVFQILSLLLCQGRGGRSPSHPASMMPGSRA